MNAIRQLINIEYKYIDNNANSITSSSSGAINALSGIAQGTDVSNRVGDSIRGQSLDFNLTVTRNGTDGNFRCIVFRDTENQGATPSVSDVLQTVGTAVNTVTPYNWFNKNLNSGKNRIVVLYDEVMSLEASDTNMTVKLHFPASEMKHIRYRGTTNGSASFAEGALFALFITDQSASQPLYTWYSRLTFTDD